MIAQIGRQIFPLLLDTIEEFSITSFEAGIALSLLWGVYALCQFSGGRFSDVLSHKTFSTSQSDL